MNTRLDPAPSHIAMRNDRRTSRTAWARRPSSAAITGAQAPVKPSSAHMMRLSRNTASVAAANGTGPSRDTNMTSTA
jgi:hypothetical protein